MNFRENFTKNIANLGVFALVGILLFGVLSYFWSFRKGNFEDLAGKIINCEVGGITEKTFTLNADGTFKMMILPFDVWGHYTVENRDDKAGVADVKFAATNIFSENGNRTKSLEREPLEWSMRVDFSRADSVDVESDDVVMRFSDDGSEALWEVLSDNKIVITECREEA